MIKIGDFSKLSQVSVKTLRYYDRIGLLKPAHVDRFSGYRYYAVDQLPRLNRILALKDLNFSLEQIAGLLDRGQRLRDQRTQPGGVLERSRIRPGYQHLPDRDPISRQ